MKKPSKVTQAKVVKAKPSSVKKVKVNGKSVITSEWRTDLSKQVLGFAILPKTLKDKFDYQVEEGGAIVQVARK